MKKIRTVVLGALSFIVVYLFLGYGNQHVHPNMNEEMLKRFQANATSVFSPIAKFKNYSFVFNGMFGYVGKEVTSTSLVLFSEADAEKNARDWIMHGGFSADEPEIYQSFRHFYDPTEPARNRYLHDHLDSWPLEYKGANPQIDQIEWATTNIEHAYNWETGIEAMKWALTNSNENVKAEKYAIAYRALGETLHMIADMGCPSHVRDDSHPVPLGVWWLGSPDPYEEYFEKYSAIDVLFSEGKTDPDLKKAFSNAKRVDSIAIILAQYTNRNFFTSQTISGKTVVPLIHPEKTYPSPKLEEFAYNENSYTYTKNISGNEVMMCKDLRYRYGVWEERGYPYMDKECVLSQGMALVPQILEAGANVIRLFIPVFKVEITKFDEDLTTISGKVIHEKSDEYFQEIKYSGKVAIYDAKSRDKIVDVNCINGEFEEEIKLKDFKKVDWKVGIYAQIEFGGIYVKSEPYTGLKLKISAIWFRIMSTLKYTQEVVYNTDAGHNRILSYMDTLISSEYLEDYITKFIQSGNLLTYSLDTVSKEGEHATRNYIFRLKNDSVIESFELSYTRVFTSPDNPIANYTYTLSFKSKSNPFKPDQCSFTPTTYSFSGITHEIVDLFDLSYKYAEPYVYTGYCHWDTNSEGEQIGEYHCHKNVHLDYTNTFLSFVPHDEETSDIILSLGLR